MISSHASGVGIRFLTNLWQKGWLDNDKVITNTNVIVRNVNNNFGEILQSKSNSANENFDFVTVRNGSSI